MNTLIQKAASLATEVHSGQFYKGTKRPYLYHPLAVSALVLRYGGDEAQAAAALVHDLIGEPRGSFEALSAELSPEVAHLAHAFADPALPPEQSGDWNAVRRAYLVKLGSLGERELLVIACEELHELDELIEDLRLLPRAEVWGRYATLPHNVGWYFREVLLVLNQKLRSQPQLLSSYAVKLKQLLAIAFEGA
jgi:(p)ppGpp synthase/HD superfamily hydrolase